MNIFIVPSWYPSPSNQNAGVFFKEQAISLAQETQNINIGISTWGQNDERLLLWSGRAFQSLGKLLLHSKPKSSVRKLASNVFEYFTPAYTWSSKIFQGNINQIIKANLINLNKFQKVYGKVDMIHAHVGFPGGYISKQLSDIFKIPYVITEHMGPFPHKHFLSHNKNLDNRLREPYFYASRIIAVSISLKDQMEGFGIKKIISIPNLINSQFFSIKSYTKKNELFTFFSLARIVSIKGIDVLLQAFSNLNRNVILKIGGSGEQLITYKKLAVELGIDGRVDWLGELNREQALHQFQQCDAFVLPSRHESMGVVFVEAMACGKPVIGTRCGGPEEFIDESNGYLIEVENESRLSEAMEKMIQNYDRFDAEHIQKQCFQKFSPKVICQQIMNVYKQEIASSSKK